MDALIKKYALKNALDFGSAQSGPVISKILQEMPQLKSELKSLMPKINATVAEINAMSPDARQKMFCDFEKELNEIDEKRARHLKGEQEKGLPSLPGDTSKVVMRLAPFPSGPLHIGNTRQFILNDEYVKMYHGKLLLVIDDTIGSAEKQIAPDAYSLIPEGLNWLGINYDKNVIYKSDRLEIYYKHAEEIIKKDFAYVCTCPSETLRENREKGKECVCRQKSIGDNLNDWKKMLNGDYQEGKAALRIKTSMSNKNPAFRDRVLFRISETTHPRVGKKYRVWPLLEFSWAIDDVLLGITHILRGKDLMIETEMENYIWNIFGWKHPEVLHTGLLKVEGVKLSKSKAQAEVKSGQYSGWDDPRTWSLQSLKKRGILPEAIRKFVLSSRMSQSEITVPVDSLYSENRKILDAVASRYFAVEAPVWVNLPIKKTVELPLHPDKPAKRELLVNGGVYVSGNDFQKFENSEVRLMDLANILLSPNPEILGSENRNVQKIQWVPKDNVEFDVIMPDGNKKRLIAESNALNIKDGETVQFVRFGFCRKEGSFYFAH